MLTLLKGGKNNRVFRMDLPEQNPVILKRYFQHPDDPRPRLKTEFSFLSFAWEKGIRCIPEPLQCNEAENWGLYSFLPGTLATASDVTDQAIDEVLSFFSLLNQHKQEASHLRAASEACFRLQDYADHIDKRMIKLDSIESIEVRNFVEKELHPAWNKLKKNYDTLSLSWEELCLTPSDFGFHNILVENQHLFFLDFEYAGWDDPAKTVCDFFCQPKIPVPFHYFEKVSRKMAAVAANETACFSRIERVFPLCKIKWCCIMLNGFFGVGKLRRTFAGAEEQRQLAQVREYLDVCHI